MSNYLYRYLPLIEVTDPENPPVQPHRPQKNSAYVATLASLEDVYLLPNTDDLSELIGHWDNDGSLAVVDMPAYEQLRPLGNDAGVATDALDLMHYQGHAQRHLQAAPAPDTMPEYPSDDQPFSIVMTRHLKPETEEWPGWSWKATITFADPNREPTSRAIGIYPGGDYDAAGWPTGAFVWTEVGTELDENEEEIPVMAWQTVCPPGRETVTPEPLYYALLHGSAHEGRMTLPDGQESLERLFWEHDQPVAPGAGEWVTISAVTNGMAGTVCLTSPDNSEIPDGSLVRIDGTESTVTSLWNTGGIVLDPYLAHASGLPIEVWM